MDILTIIKVIQYGTTSIRAPNAQSNEGTRVLQRDYRLRVLAKHDCSVHYSFFADGWPTPVVACRNSDFWRYRDVSLNSTHEDPHGWVMTLEQWMQPDATPQRCRWRELCHLTLQCADSRFRAMKCRPVKWHPRLAICRCMQLTVAPVNCRTMICGHLTVAPLRVARWSIATPAYPVFNTKW